MNSVDWNGGMDCWTGITTGGAERHFTHAQKFVVAREHSARIVDQATILWQELCSADSGYYLTELMIVDSYSSGIIMGELV